MTKDTQAFKDFFPTTKRYSYNRPYSARTLRLQARMDAIGGGLDKDGSQWRVSMPGSYSICPNLADVEYEVESYEDSYQRGDFPPKV